MEKNVKQFLIRKNVQRITKGVLSVTWEFSLKTNTPLFERKIMFMLANLERQENIFVELNIGCDLYFGRPYRYVYSLKAS